MSASGYSGSNVPANAIDGDPATYWQSSTTTGWLAVRFAQSVQIDEVHAHFRTTKYARLSLYVDRDGDGTYETKAWSTTGNAALDVVIGFAPTPTYGIKLTIDAKVGSNKPMISELEAYLRYDSDGDGLLNAFQSGTVYYVDVASARLPVSVPNRGSADATLPTNVLAGVPFRGLADFTVDYAGAKEDLSASLAYWDGTAWMDAGAWDPGGQLVRPSITSPANAAVAEGIVPVRATVADSDLVARAEFYLDSESTPRATDTQPDGSVYAWDWDTLGQPEGSHRIRARVVDVWGAAFEDSVTVSVDRNPPDLQINSPGEGAVLSSTVVVTWAASDAGTGLASIWVALDGDWTNVGPLATSHTYTSVPGGTHTLTVYALDNANHARQASVTVTVDAAPPVVSITYPTNSPTLDGVIHITATASDTYGIARVDFAHDGTIIASDAAAPYEAWWDTSGVGEGWKHITATAVDVVGNTWSVVESVNIDHNPPTVTITTPANGAIVKGAVWFNVSSADPVGTVSFVALYIDGVLQVSGPSSSYMVPWDTTLYAEGTHTLSATARDGLYHIDFNWDHYDTIYGVTIRIFDSHGRMSEINYILEVSPQDPQRTLPPGTFFGFTETVPGFPPVIETSLAGALTSTVSTLAGALSWVPLMTVVALLLISAPTSKAVTDPGPADVALIPDAYPLATWATFVGEISLYPGYSATANGLLRGTGWNLISALYPGITFDTIANTMSYGTWSSFGSMWVVEWATTVSGVATLYRLLIENGVILSLEMSEIVIDKFGSEVTLDNYDVARHYDKRHGENPAQYPSLDAYKSEIKQTLQDPNELWHSSGNNLEGIMHGWLYVRWTTPGAMAFIVILNEDRTFASAGFRELSAVLSISHTTPWGARFDVCVHPIPPPR